MFGLRFAKATRCTLNFKKDSSWIMKWEPEKGCRTPSLVNLGQCWTMIIYKEMGAVRAPIIYMRACARIRIFFLHHFPTFFSRIIITSRINEHERAQWPQLEKATTSGKFQKLFYIAVCTRVITDSERRASCSQRGNGFLKTFIRFF